MGGRPHKGDLAEVIRDFRREQVIAGARQLFSDRASIEVSMEEIAAAAGVSRSTLYKHFSNRDDVLTACLEAARHQLVEDLTVALGAEDGTTADHLRTFLRVVLDVVDQNAAFFRIAVAVQNGPAELGLATKATITVTGLEVGTVLDELVRRGIDDGTFRSGEPQRTITAIGQVLYGAISFRTEDPDPPPPAEAATELRDLLLHGLGSPG